MKSRSVIKFENFLLICGATAGASLGALAYSWIVLPMRSVYDAHSDAKDFEEFIENVPNAYNKNVINLSQTPMIAYNMAKLRATQRLQEFDKKTK